VEAEIAGTSKPPHPSPLQEGARGDLPRDLEPGAPGFSAASVVMMRLVQTLTELTAALVGVVMLRRAEKDGEAKR